MSKRTTAAHASEQLCLLESSDLPVQFRLDERTRLRGLAHIAEIRRILAAKQPGGVTPNRHKRAA
ncbi:MAG: hypothetical protein ABIQ39_00325 [Ilumatobacteraceae bacterium]